MKLLRLLHLVLREIFDEAAYERFCAGEKLEYGRTSYKMFLSGIGRRKPPVRCC